MLTIYITRLKHKGQLVKFGNDGQSTSVMVFMKYSALLTSSLQSSWFWSSLCAF
jgi:hypothetical protein